jgi:hypothetical protein
MFKADSIVIDVLADNHDVTMARGDSAVKASEVDDGARGTADGGDNDEAEPSSMVDSVLRGGSSTTSAPLLCLSCLPTPASGVSAPPCFAGCNNDGDHCAPERGTSNHASMSSNMHLEESFDDWLALLEYKSLQFPEEEKKENIAEVDSQLFISEDNELEQSKPGGRKSAEDGKNVAFFTPVVRALEYVYQPCNNLCYLNGNCTKNISGKSILDLRVQYFRPEGEDAPKDKERSLLIMQYLDKARKDDEGNLIFSVDQQDVCTSAFLRILGVSTSADTSKAPGQWQRLIKSLYTNDNNVDTLLSSQDITLTSADDNFTTWNGHCKAFMNEVAMYFSDCLPMVVSEEGDTEAMQVPYGTVLAFYEEYCYHYQSMGYGPAEYASYKTFLRAFNALHSDGVLKLLGGKSGFTSCALCNNVVTIKRSACCKRDKITAEALKKLSRLHILQQSTERQHAENFISLAKGMKDGQPTRAYFDIDPQSTWTGNTPKMSKDRLSKLDHCIENRNIGVRIVCGPIDEYISICTDNLIPHGANVLIEVVRYCFEYLGRRLAQIDPDMIVPKTVGLQFDNSGENKNKEMFCFLSHLIEENFFQEIEMMFLVVGHTHNILDQWFSVLGKAVRKAHFIGSVLALHELYKIAHSDDEAKKPAHIYQLQTYHDWRRFYDPVRNTDIHHFNVPLRFRFKLDEFLKIAKMEYMYMSPPHGFKHMEKWQPVTVGIRQNTDINGSVPIYPFAIFNGAATVIEALGMKKIGPNSLTEIASGNKKDFYKYDEFREIMPVIRELEVRTVGESAIRMNQEAERGYSDEKVTLKAALLQKIDDEISRNNSSAGGRIVWLRRSKCSNPDYLNGRPDVLPNPKLWRQRIANNVETTIDRGIAAQEATSSTLVTRSDETTAKNKRIKLDAAEATQRLLHFQKGASDIAATAAAMLKFTENESVVPVAKHNNIVSATNNFQRISLTPREIAWYEARIKTRDIGLQAEARADAEEKKGWKLLNLPEETPAQRQRKEDQIREREKRTIEVEKQLRSLLVREGEGEYDPDRQVVSFDGFEAAKSQDLDKMTRPQLEALVKGIMKTKDVKTLKVDQLRAHVKKLAEANPGLLQIPTANAARIATSDVEASGSIVVNKSASDAPEAPPNEVNAFTSTEIPNTQQSCSVQEVLNLHYICIYYINLTFDCLILYVLYICFSVIT